MIKKENKMSKYGWYRMNGVYYVYDRELECIPSCTTTEYLDTTSKKTMEQHLRTLNKDHSFEKEA